MFDISVNLISLSWHHYKFLSIFSDYCKDNIIVIVIHFKQDDYFEYGDSEKKVKGLVAKILDWDMRRVPEFDNELTLSDLLFFLKSTFETFNIRNIFDVTCPCKCKCKCSDKK
jgi:hypothetical protein